MVECIETYDDRLKTEGQLLLNACLEMERPPRHACFFDFSATGIDAAHENDMRVGGWVRRWFCGLLLCWLLGS